MKLCYIDPDTHTAYFTELPLTGEGKVWGDDWNDSPYEHNAGTPYDYSVMLKYSEKNGYFNEPNYSHLNSPYSVEEINTGHVPWLWASLTGEVLYAGATVVEFKNYIHRNGGIIWVQEEPK